MTTPPAHPKIYHIAHVDRLAHIVRDGALLCDAAMIERTGTGTTIGMASIKQRRLRLPVTCHPDINVGGCVPFYFCPRSVMLYLIYRANHPELTYRGGQEPIVHLEADLHRVVEWADAHERAWALSLSNAGANYVEFRSRLSDLHELNWQAIAATDFRSPEVNEGKQAEFLVHRSFPWALVERVGVQSQGIKARAEEAMEGCGHEPSVDVMPGWYY